MAKIWTLGYEGLSPDGFRETLQKAGIKRVVDVREAPVSRKPGFSKGPMERSLADAGIGYEVRKGLGVPKLVRDRYKSSGAWEPFARWYEDHLDAVGEQVAGLAMEAEREPVCLVCFEGDAERCHRGLLAKRLAKAGFDVVHL